MFNFQKENRFFILASVSFIILFAAVVIYRREVENKITNIKKQLYIYNNRAKLVTLTLIPQNNSKETGKATLKEVKGQVVVNIILENYPKGVSQPAQILLGRCGGSGQVVYQLKDTVNGKSETTLKYNISSIFNGRTMALSIQKSSFQTKSSVSCANLPLNY